MEAQVQETQTKAPQEYKNVVYWLRNKSGLKIKTGVLNGKRADYFKGKSAVKALTSDAFKKVKRVPSIENEDQAKQLLHMLIPHAFFFRVNKGPSSGGLRQLQINPQQMFTPDETYVWFVEPNPIRQILMALGMVAIVLAGVMFPLWPVKMRIGVWYLSMALLGLIALFFVIAIVRLVVWLVTIVVASPGIWIFPNLFADVGFVDSFIPLWSWDVPPPKKQKSHHKKKKDKKSKEEHHHHSGNGQAKITEIKDE